MIDFDKMSEQLGKTQPGGWMLTDYDTTFDNRPLGGCSVLRKRLLRA